MDRYDVLVFDVLGTLLDEPAGVLGAAHIAIGDSDVTQPAVLAERWTRFSDDALAAVVAGRAPFEPLDVVMGRALAEAATELGLELAADDIDDLARVGHRLEPFPDTVAAFDHLAAHHVMIGLTNGGLGQALDMSAHGGLRWHTVISAESVGAYKPDPRMYDFVADRLGVDPSHSLFVAAHPWDLDGAAGQGFHTAYIDRAGSTDEQLAAYAGTYDLVARDLAALADLLIRPV